MTNVTYSIVIPAYNEEPVIDEMYRRTTAAMQALGEPYEILFVDDGSHDRTLAIVKEIQQTDACVKVLSLARNYGHQLAITAGLEHASGKAVVVIDADLQDPPELIAELAGKWKEGYDVVYAQRDERKGETFFKKVTASLFYRFMRKVAQVDLPPDTGDFRLMSRRVVDSLNRFREQHRFVRGLVSWIGYRQVAVTYVRDERFAGETHYSFPRMLKFAIDGIASFSYVPLRMATVLGVLLAMASSLGIAGVVILRFLHGQSVLLSGGSILVLLVMLLGGIQLLALGLIGEYVGRIYDEVKHRPLYLLEEEIGFEE